ncbi:hypothetical protein LTR96_011903 [Exophiala xenobiotica]|nr:hypothetical protein LTR96_011903 [Exophiala xenobiotica]
MDDFVRRVQNITIGGRYHLQRKLGPGSFGKVYLGLDADSGNEVAIKLEHCNVGPSLLEEEASIYQALTGKPGFPKVYWSGQREDFMALIFELLGPDLEDLFRYCGNQFSLKTTLMLADQLLRRLEVLHSRNYLHRDIKPENFLLGMQQQGNTVYMTDLGLAKYDHPDRRSFKSPPSHAATTRPPQLLGTCRYASIKGHLGSGRWRIYSLIAGTDGAS